MLKVKVTGYDNCPTVASDPSLIPHTDTPLCYLRPLPAWVCMSIRLPMFSNFVI